MFYSSRQVAKMLGVNPSRLSRAIWDGRIDEPPRGPGNFFLWGEKEIEQASWVLRHKSADDVLKTLGDSTEAPDDISKVI